jgi:hypothetical protein
LQKTSEPVLNRRVISRALLLAAVLAAPAAGQQIPYDGIQAGLDAFRLAEEKRRADLAEQLFLNDQLKYWSGLPTSRGETIYYGHGGPGYSAYGYATPVLPPANLDYTYAYGDRRSWGPARQRGWRGPLTVFEPWPYVPGNIYGYQYYSPVRQPVAQWQGQTGPNRWESHPVYDPPLTPYQPLPPVVSPWLDGTPYATPYAYGPPSGLPPEPPQFELPYGNAEELPPELPSELAPPRGPREY